MDLKIFDFLQQIPATSYPYLLGCFTTLIGVCASNKANDARQIRQFNNDRETKRRELVTGKLEDLYILFRQWNNNTQSCYADYIIFTQQSSNLLEALNKATDSLEKYRGDLNRIEMLINLYFPFLKPDYKKVVEARDRANTIMLTHFQNYNEVNKDVNHLLESLHTALDAFNEETERFVKLIEKQAENL